MIHLIKAGKNKVSGKVLYRLESAEVTAGIVQGGVFIPGKPPVNLPTHRPVRPPLQRPIKKSIVELENADSLEVAPDDWEKLKESLFELSTGELGLLADHFSENRHEAPYGAELFYTPILKLIHSEMVRRIREKVLIPTSGNRVQGDLETKATLDKSRGSGQDADVKEKIRSLPVLLDALRERTKKRGQKSALARELNVSRQALDQWLSGKTKPSAETTFELLKRV